MTSRFPARKARFKPLMLAGALLAAVAFAPSPALAHCDTLDGPVVADARRALDLGRLDPVLKWIPAAAEPELRQAFERTRAVRGAGGDARSLADRYFFETLVRLHRASEGAPFTGLQPAGSTSPGIAAADEALRTGSVDALADHMAAAVRAEIVRRFEDAHRHRAQAESSPEAGRAFVETYVRFTHLIEALEQIPAEGHDRQGAHDGHR